MMLARDVLMLCDWLLVIRHNKEGRHLCFDSSLLFSI